MCNLISLKSLSESEFPNSISLIGLAQLQDNKWIENMCCLQIWLSELKLSTLAFYLAGKSNFLDLVGRIGKQKIQTARNLQNVNKDCIYDKFSRVADRMQSVGSGLSNPALQRFNWKIFHLAKFSRSWRHVWTSRYIRVLNFV